jgi:phage terminase large subunit-like protein
MTKKKIPSQTSTDFTATANKYAADVISGAVPACKWVRLACERQVKDLAKQNDPAWSYVFDSEKANRVCKFVSALKHVSGELSGTPIKLEPWQVFILTVCFGWVNKATGRRRFRRAYIEIPRGNGKSAISSGVALYMLSADKEAGAQVVVAARVKDQTRFVTDASRAMVKNNAALRNKFGLKVLAHSIEQESSMSTMRALASEADSLDGLSCHLAVLDEVHAHKTREVYDSLSTACAKRTQAMLWMITTAGSDQIGVGYTTSNFTKKLLDGNANDESFFGIVYTADESDKWDEEATWIKANPNWRISVQPEAVADEANRARQMPANQASFRMKHLCQWMNADHTWLDAEKLKACLDASLNESAFEGHSALFGLDLADKTDFSSIAKLFVKEIDGDDHYFVFSDNFLPEDTARGSQYNATFNGWAHSGWLKLTPGSVIDVEWIDEQIIKESKRFRLRECAFDGYHAMNTAVRLDNEGLTMVAIPMSVKTMNPAMRRVEELVLQKRLHFNNPVLLWALSNIVCHQDVKGNIYPRKESHSSENRIDPAVAMFLALHRTIVEPLEASRHYKGKLAWAA